MRGRLHLVVAVSILAGVVGGCAPETSAQDTIMGRMGRVRSPIISGVASTVEQDFVLMVGLESVTAPTTGTIAPTCSASLVAKNLLLTARHCVGDFDDATERMTSTWAAARFAVYSGKDGPLQIERKTTPAARGKRVVTANTDTLAPDVAFIVLDRDVSAPLARLRLKSGVEKGEKVNAIGFGMNERSAFGAVRMQKQGLPVVAIAPETTKFHPTLNPGEFVFVEAVCYGDSGGPAVSATSNAVVGVASRVSSGQLATDAEPNKPCVDGSEDVFTSLAQVRALVDSAFAAAGAKPLLEGEPTEEAEKEPTETKPQTAETDDDDDAAEERAPKRRRLQNIPSSGCAAAPGSRPSGVLAGLLGIVALVGRRRRDRAR